MMSPTPGIFYFTKLKDNLDNLRERLDINNINSGYCTNLKNIIETGLDLLKLKNPKAYDELIEEFKKYLQIKNNN